jgi:hypothetical protein
VQVPDERSRDSVQDALHKELTQSCGANARVCLSAATS